MIQLATAPNPSRMGLPSAANDERGSAFEFRRARTGHAWPFISRQVDRPERPRASQNPSGDSGS